jgi:hypothetical protein
MAKNIKAIKCPNCGSIQNIEIRPDYYRCKSCDTEYYLDDDDINININHNTQPSQQQQTPPFKKKNALVMLLFVAIVPVAFIILNLVTGRPSGSKLLVPVTEKKYDFGSAGEIVYRNTRTGKAVYMRLGREAIEGADHSVDFVNTHVVFIDPVAKKQFKEDMLLPHIRRLDDYFPRFETFRDESIYMVYPGARLFTIDREKDRLVEVTKSLFKNHPELSAGLATIGLSDDYMDLLTNDGNKYYYIPEKDLLTTDYDERNKVLKSMESDTFFQFNNNELMKLTPGAKGEDRKFTNLTPGRKYFDPDIIYQNKSSLIIATGATASPQAPVMLQSIDVNTGKIIWTQPARTFYYRSGARCNEGFAVEYASGEDQDYISGVLIISPEGTVVSDYLIKRNE